MTADDMARARRVLMRRDPVLAPIIRKYGACGIKTGRESDIFCGLVEAIVSQQLSTRAAATIYGRLRALLPNGGTPTPEALIPLSDEALARCGPQPAEARLHAGSQRQNARRFDKPSGLAGMSDDEIVAELTKIKGIGRWTVEMLLIFRLTRPDVFPAGDLGIVKAVQKAYNLRKTPDVKRLQRLPSDGGHTARSPRGTSGPVWRTRGSKKEKIESKSRK